MEIPMITSAYPTICADSVSDTRDFYVDVIGFKVVFDSGWFVQLHSPTNPAVQIGIVERSHLTVPAKFQLVPAGVIITIEVDNVDEIHAVVNEAGLETPLKICDEAFGQRHFMTVDPNGALVDIVTPIPPTAEYAAAYAAGAEA
jgi:catechol 2,3-dioxygenase-like lactoylglutathione lyase family enzyme